MLKMLLSMQLSTPSMLFWRSATPKRPLADLAIWQSLEENTLVLWIAVQGTLFFRSFVRPTCCDTRSATAPVELLEIPFRVSNEGGQSTSYVAVGALGMGANHAVWGVTSHKAGRRGWKACSESISGGQGRVSWPTLTEISSRSEERRASRPGESVSSSLVNGTVQLSSSH